MSGSTEHLLSIKEASRLTGVPAYTLRFWEKEFEDYLRPPRTEGGQRRFDETSLKMVERIKQLVDDEKYSIAGARGVLALEKQQSEQRNQVSLRLRNEEQIDLILDEIAEILREKVLARLLREEGSNRVVGERVPGLKLSQLAGASALPATEPARPAPSGNGHGASATGSARPLSMRTPSESVLPAQPNAAPAPGSASQSTLRHSFSALQIPTPQVTEG